MQASDHWARFGGWGSPPSLVAGQCSADAPKGRTRQTRSRPSAQRERKNTGNFESVARPSRGSFPFQSPGNPGRPAYRWGIIAPRALAWLITAADGRGGEAPQDSSCEDLGRPAGASPKRIRNFALGWAQINRPTRKFEAAKRAGRAGAGIENRSFRRLRAFCPAPWPGPADEKVGTSRHRNDDSLGGDLRIPPDSTCRRQKFVRPHVGRYG